MRNITVIGAGRVGLVTAICLADVGHFVRCFDLDNHKINQLKSGIPPFYEPDLENYLNKNLNKGRLSFTNNIQEALTDIEIIYLAVGTPQNEDGTTNLDFIMKAAEDIAENIGDNPTIIVTKSTVPVGTNSAIKKFLYSTLKRDIKVEVVSNPEFLREGSAIYDSFHGDRIVIGSDNEWASGVIEEVNKPFGIPIFQTDIRSAEMIKYASNTFLATKITLLNELANICEHVGADIEEVTYGIGLDHRIGSTYMKPGIGFGGSCFPKDLLSLLQTAKEVGVRGDLIESVMKVNANQNIQLLQKAKNRFGRLQGKKAALLGLSFKPNTDDIRNSVALVLAKELIKEGLILTAYDPASIENAKAELGDTVKYTQSIEEAITGVEMVFIATDWDEIKDFPLRRYEELMLTPILFDGWNCYPLNQAANHHLEYFSIGRRK
ncbi:UDP-glucose/GDP-mannose dehydrogenase family protein [Bacillus sp. EB106-08-02-XG196]|uniref:UDP-glucose dehydrogenase family protein n=1 Tax=Bacillus sp. EB106-08-02-XG196 TaxID=2737049 RepID=UPI0015C46049|nr:UDP-glucose/GDP-mannose dehydrogenase family protein [Bacillus sp. EB106-08-02-XG196]NWQ41818.1 UDP-glucose/GDP-mannose dehydrogenase family protein [Bacillus sp. EB106-08-02-XG196]